MNEQFISESFVFSLSLHTHSLYYCLMIELCENGLLIATYQKRTFLARYLSMLQNAGRFVFVSFRNLLVLSRHKQLQSNFKYGFAHSVYLDDNHQPNLHNIGKRIKAVNFLTGKHQDSKSKKQWGKFRIIEKLLEPRTEVVKRNKIPDRDKRQLSD